MSNFVKYYLSKYLKVFLSDYKSNEMKIDLIKGKVKMQNVVLNNVNLTYLLKVPPIFEIDRVVCSEFSAVIPWRSMKSEPVVIKIKGLQVVLKERKGSVKSIAKDVNRPNRIVDKAFKKKHKKEKSKKKSKRGDKRFVTDILDNLSVSISDAQIRVDLLKIPSKWESDDQEAKDLNKENGVPSEPTKQDAEWKTIFLEISKIVSFVVNENYEQQSLSSLRSANKGKPFNYHYRVISFEPILAFVSITSEIERRLQWFQTSAFTIRFEYACDWLTNKLRSIVIKSVDSSANVILTTQTLKELKKVFQMMEKVSKKNSEIKRTLACCEEATLSIERLSSPEPPEQKSEEFDDMNDSESSSDLDSELDEINKEIEQISAEFDEIAEGDDKRHESLIDVVVLLKFTKISLGVENIMLEIFGTSFSFSSILEKENLNADQKFSEARVQSTLQVVDASLILFVGKAGKERRNLLSHLSESPLLTASFSRTTGGGADKTDIAAVFSALTVSVSDSMVIKLLEQKRIGKLIEFVVCHNKSTKKRGTGKRKKASSKAWFEQLFGAFWLDDLSINAKFSDIQFCLQLKAAAKELCFVCGCLGLNSSSSSEAQRQEFRQPAAVPLPPSAPRLEELSVRQTTSLLAETESSVESTASATAAVTVEENACSKSPFPLLFTLAGIKIMLREQTTSKTINIISPFDIETEIKFPLWNECYAIMKRRASVFAAVPCFAVSVAISTITLSLDDFAALGHGFVFIKTVKSVISKCLSDAKISKSKRGHAKTSSLSQETSDKKPESVLKIIKQMARIELATRIEGVFISCNISEKRFAPVLKQIGDDKKVSLLSGLLPLLFDPAEELTVFGENSLHTSGKVMSKTNEKHEKEKSSTEMNTTAPLLSSLSKTMETVAVPNARKKVKKYRLRTREFQKQQHATMPRLHGKDDDVVQFSGGDKTDLFRFFFVAEEFNGNILCALHPKQTKERDSEGKMNTRKRLFIQTMFKGTTILFITPEEDDFRCYLTSKENNSFVATNSITLNLALIQKWSKGNFGGVQIDLSNLLMQFVKTPKGRIKNLFLYLQSLLTKKKKSTTSSYSSFIKENKQSFQTTVVLNDGVVEYFTAKRSPPHLISPHSGKVIAVGKANDVSCIFRMNLSETKLSTDDTIKKMEETFAKQLMRLNSELEKEVIHAQTKQEKEKEESKEVENLLLTTSVEISKLREENQQLKFDIEELKDERNSLNESLGKINLCYKFAQNEKTNLVDYQNLVTAITQTSANAMLETEKAIKENHELRDKIQKLNEIILKKDAELLAMSKRLNSQKEDSQAIPQENKKAVTKNEREDATPQSPETIDCKQETGIQKSSPGGDPIKKDSESQSTSLETNQKESSTASSPKEQKEGEMNLSIDGKPKRRTAFMILQERRERLKNEKKTK